MLTSMTNVIPFRPRTRASQCQICLGAGRYAPRECVPITCLTCDGKGVVEPKEKSL